MSINFNRTNWEDHSLHGQVFTTTLSKTIVMTSYSLLMSVGFVLNVVICITYVNRRIRKNSFNTCLCNLAVADIVFITGLLPYICCDMHKNHRYNLSTLTDLACGFRQGSSFAFCGAFAAIHTMSFMSIQRFLAVKTPFKVNLSNIKKVQVFIVLDWVLCIILHIPNQLLWTNHQGFCYRDWKWGRTFKIVYIIILYLMGLLVVILIMLVTLILTAVELFIKSSSTTDISREKYRKRVVILLVAIILVWFFTNAPYGVYWLLAVTNHFSHTAEGELRRQRWKWYAYMAGLVKTVLSPIIYFWASKDFRRSVYSTIWRKRRITP